MDTGATEDENQFPVYKAVRKLIDEWEKTKNSKVKLIVAHTYTYKFVGLHQLTPLLV
jgi:hypothetical protein